MKSARLAAFAFAVVAPAWAQLSDEEHACQQAASKQSGTLAAKTIKCLVACDKQALKGKAPADDACRRSAARRSSASTARGRRRSTASPRSARSIAPSATQAETASRMRRRSWTTSAPRSASSRRSFEVGDKALDLLDDLELDAPECLAPSLSFALPIAQGLLEDFDPRIFCESPSGAFVE